MSRAGAAWALALVVLASAPFEAALLRGETLVYRDLTPQFYPRCVAIGEALARGEVPRWNPLCFHGAPWFGPRAGGVLYPANLLFGWLPPGRAMALFMTLHVALACEGARRLLRARIGPDGARAAGLAFGLGGFLLSQHWALPYLVSAAWLPWAAHGGQLAATRPGAGAALIGLAVGLTLLAAEPQGALLQAALAVALAAACQASPSRARTVSVATIGVGLGAALAGPQLLSILAELPDTHRAAGGWSDPRWGAPPLGLAGLLVAPGVFGEWAGPRLGYWGGGLWGGELPWCGLGVGALGLAAITAALADPVRRRAARPGMILVAIGLLLASGGVGPALGLRFSAKWLVLTALGLAWLLGCGWTGLGDRAAGVALRVQAALAVLAAAAAGLSLPRLAPILHTLPGVHGVAAREAVGSALVRLALVTLLALAVDRLRREGRVPPATGRALLLGALALDLLTAGRGWIESTRAPVLERPAIVDLVQGATRRPPGVPPPLYSTKRSAGKAVFDPLREDVLARVLVRQRDTLVPNLGYGHGVRVVEAFESVEPRLGALLVAESGRTPADMARLLDLVDAETLVATSLAAVESGHLVALGRVGEGDVFVVANQRCPPWAYVAPRARAAPTAGEAVAATLDPARTITGEVVLGPEGAPRRATEGGGPGEPATIGPVEFAAERVVLDVQAPAAGWLVVRESFAPGWGATIDGAPVPIARADALFRAVRVPAGRSLVVMTYEPTWWRPGLLMLACGGIGMCAALASHRMPRPDRACL